MHRQFRELLEDARGKSEFIVAINLDIRSFSPFSKQEESTNVAMFIKCVYKKLIDEYFKNASFYKATGDGLLVTIPYSEKTLKTVVIQSTIICIKVMFDFSSFCEKDSMINFNVPEYIGIGLCRGPACRLSSGEITLDYSGSLINKASRLMDFARPSGIVLDGGFGFELLPEGIQEYFEKEEVYVRGIAERTPIGIYYTKDYTKISSESKKPLVGPHWMEVKSKFSLKQIEDLSPQFIVQLPSKPSNQYEIIVKVNHPCVKDESFPTTHNFAGKYEEVGGSPQLILDFEAISKRLSSEGLKQTSEAELIIIYPE